MCEEPIKQKEAPTYKGLEYCSADCALKAWEADNDS